ncbi:MAG: hypothetical protein J6W95_05735, partial [Bacteroidales bacterium]|nr:hypothetical protein [Bacteroidales bacterium]
MPCSMAGEADPWAENSINGVGENNSNLPQTNQDSKQDVNAIIGRLCSKLEHIYSESLNTGFDIPICVVVTKCDINGLSNAIGADEHFTQSSNKWKA